MSIEKELLERLKAGVYGSDGIVNESQEAFTKALDELQEDEVDEDVDGEVENEMEDNDEVEYVGLITDRLSSIRRRSVNMSPISVEMKTILPLRTGPSWTTRMIRVLQTSLMEKVF
jgi:hypothetical protein